MDYPYDLGPYPRKVTTSSADAQRWFNRGRKRCFGFHHEEAVACFEKALAVDPSCVRGWPSPRRCWRARSPTAVAEHDACFARLRAAIALEDDLPYDEPWRWMQPIRHALGALLLEQGRAAEAVLSRGSRPRRAPLHPDNLWALRGLLDCLERRGETAEAALIRQRVDFAAARADLPVSVSGFCARGKAA